MDVRANMLGWPTWLWRCAILLSALFAVSSVANGVSGIARSAGLLHDLARPEASFTQRPETPAGWLETVAVDPGGAADRAGIEPGDRVRFEGPCCRANQLSAVTVERDGRRFRGAIVATRSTYAVPELAFLGGLGGLLTAGFGLLLLLRGRGNRAAALLGMVLLSLAAGRTSVGGPWAPTDAMGTYWRVAGVTADAVFAYLWPFFALAVSGGSSSRRQAMLVQAVALFAAALTLGTSIAATIPVYLPIFGSFTTFDLVFVTLHQGFGYVIIASNYRRNDAPARNRIKIVAGAFVCFMLSEQVLQILRGLLLGGTRNTDQALWLIGATNLLTYAALALLAYAVLRQQLFNLNFALNRTLVYGAVSFVLLAAFGIAKWVLEHLIPEAWHEGSEFYSFGIALALFLSLHRVHDWVEHTVERFVFSPWHRNEAELRRFVTAAGHFNQTTALCRAFTEEAGRFAKGAGVALYLQRPGGGYALSCGTLAAAPSEQAADDLALALMRAEHRPVKAAETRTALPGVLALPMLDHGKLAGFLLLDRKGDGSDYRPDEIEVLGWAAHQVGLDLQAMHAGELEAEVAGLNARIAMLTEQCDRLGALLAGAATPPPRQPAATRRARKVTVATAPSAVK
jgi:hypothetical protein